MFVGLDDTDSSQKGGCTTYAACKVLSELEPTQKENWLYPRLIRLNPNVPFKTRGNGAIAFHVPGESDSLKDRIMETLEENFYLEDPNTNPAVVFMKSEENLDILNSFYYKCLSEFVSIQDAWALVEELDSQLEFRIYKEGRGIIGALAAIGSVLTEATYEHISYRKKKNWGKKERKIDSDSVHKVHERLFPGVFSSIDPDTGQILLTPRGPDPVFCGIRGESPSLVKAAWDLIEPLEEVESSCIFATNQATDAHLVGKNIADVKPYDCVILEGHVRNRPWTREGGHVFFSLNDETGEIDCAAYEPTGGFRDVVRGLIPGDRIRVFGGIAGYENTVNLEKLHVKGLAPLYEKSSPVCCKKRMTSAGKDNGYKCKKCGSRAPESAARWIQRERSLSPGFYEVPERARRHLSKPLFRVEN